MAAFHDAYRHKTAQNVAYNAAGGASTQSAAFGSQTRYIRVCSVGVVSATIDGVRIAVGDNPTAAATSALLPSELARIHQVYARSEDCGAW
jgi:hypothetical protein